jgi:ABC-type anion transport system duplicated permease subunit
MSRSAFHDLHFAVIVAMPVVCMMQMPVYQVVHVISMRHSLVPALWPMNMTGLMRAAGVIWRALRRVRRADFYHVFVEMIAV